MEAVRPKEVRNRTPWRAAVVSFVGVALVVCAVMLISTGNQSGSELFERNHKAKKPSARELAATDENDRAGLQKVFSKPGDETLEGSVEAKLRTAKRLDAAREERTSVMVPWVHWPGHENTGKGDEFAAPRKQLLLQIRMSHKDEADKAAQVMPLKELMEREIVDHSLARGTVSDYQLEEADQKTTRTHRARKSDSVTDLACHPFC